MEKKEEGRKRKGGVKGKMVEMEEERKGGKRI